MISNFFLKVHERIFHTVLRPERSPTVFEAYCYAACLLPVVVHCHISPVRLSPTIRIKRHLAL